MRVLDKAIALAAVAAIVWLAVAVRIAGQGACAGPSVAMVKPFGLSIDAGAPRSAP